MAKISVASKLPIGLTLEHGGKKVTFYGNNHPDALLGFGVTPEVDEEWFDAMADATMHSAILSGHIFKNTPAKIKDEVKEKTKDETLKTGLEPIDPDKAFKVAEGVETFNAKD